MTDRTIRTLTDILFGLTAAGMIFAAGFAAGEQKYLDAGLFVLCLLMLAAFYIGDRVTDNQPAGRSAARSAAKKGA